MATQPPSHVAETLLQQAHAPETASTIFKERVKLRPLHLRPTSPDPSLNARSKRQYERHQKAKSLRKSNKPKPLSAKQKRSLQIYDIPKSQRKYTIYEPLHKMWCDYMREILNLQDGRNFVDANGSAGPMLVSADYHGAKMEVVRSRCVSRVGLRGIVVKDTKFTFEMITEKDEIKTVPKEHTVFKFEVPLEEQKEKAEETGKRPLMFEIYGNQFQSRAPDRANKKFKMHIDPGL